MNFQKIGFIGLGLIGGSIAKSVKQHSPNIEMIATSGHAETIHVAHADGVISNDDLPELSAFSDCDLIFLCCPVKKNLEYLKELQPILSPTCILTDVGSVKGDIHHAITALGLEQNFIGGHPMTGSEKTGYQASFPRLFENTYYILTPTAKTGQAALTKLRDFVIALGARSMIMEPDLHDRAVAVISHLPHIAAAGLVHMIARSDDSEHTMKRIAAGGFRDLTRIASSSPIMWESICASNREQILQAITAYKEILTEIQEKILAEDEQAVLQFFADSKEYRDSMK